MALTTFLMTVSMVTIASGFNFFLAGWPSWPVNDMPFPRFPSPQLRFGPPTPPSLLGMPSFPSTFPFFALPVFPSFPPIPSVADIVKGGTSSNGGSFTGVVVSTKSESKRKEDGTIVHEGGSTIVTNNNGDIQVTKTGKAPPELELPTETPPEEEVSE